MRKMFLEVLPRINKRCIDWDNSVGYKVKFIYDDIEGIVKIVKHLREDEALLIEYNDVEHKISKVGFRKCSLSLVLGKISYNYKYNIGENIKDDKRDIVITGHSRKLNGKKSKRYYEFKCNNCGWENGVINESNLISGGGCACCANKVVVHGINDITTTDTWMVKYFQGGYDEAKLYTRGSNKKITPMCPDCGIIKNKEVIINDIHKNKGIKCNCQDGASYPNKLVFKLLSELNIKFNTEKKFEWSENKVYDFYLSELNAIVEVHGVQHYKESFSRAGGRTLKEEQENDAYKKELALKNGINNYITINAEKSQLSWIKDSVVNSKMSELVDLSVVDWGLCEEYALSNVISKVCNIKKNNPQMTSIEIANLVKISRGAIINYLKKGALLGWCNYDPKEESSRASCKLGKTGVKVEVFKDNVSCGQFNSINEIVRKSMELFGVEFTRRNISNVCRKRQKTHKGYTFKYV